MPRTSSEKIVQKLFADFAPQMAARYDNLFTALLKRYRLVQPQVSQLFSRLFDELPYEEAAKYAQRFLIRENDPFSDLPEFEHEIQKIAKSMKDGAVDPAVNEGEAQGFKKLESSKNKIGLKRAEIGRADKDDQVGEITIDHPLMKDMLSGFASQISHSRTDEPIRIAFQKAGLNQNNPLHWRVLMWMFSQAHFGAKPSSEHWTAKKYCQLLHEAEQLKTRRRLSDRSACRIIAEGKRYKDGDGKVLSKERLRKALREARTPGYNALLAGAVMAELQKRRLEGGAPEWTPEIERRHEKEIITHILKEIAERWPDRSSWAK